MKKRGLTLGASLGVALMAACVADEEPAAAGVDEPPAVTATFAVQGMTCSGCEAGVELKVGGLAGVEAVEASHEEGRATVRYAPGSVGPEAVVQAIEELAYSAELMDDEAEAADERVPVGGEHDGR